MNRLSFGVNSLLLALCFPASLVAEEIQGKVDSVLRDEFSVVIESEFEPVAGDKAVVYVVLPGVGAAQIGTARVVSVENGVVYAKTEQATGKISAGQSVRIDSPQPRRRARPESAPPEGPSPSPSTTGTSRPVEEPVPAPPPLAPSDADRQTVVALVQLLEKHHLSAHPVDDLIAERALKGFVGLLDSDRTYFTKADVSGFRRRQDQFDEQLRRGDLTLTFEIFNRYAQRVAERVALAEQLLPGPHDFTVEERWEFDPVKTDYPQDDQQVREVWRKKTKRDLLAHKWAGADDDDAECRTRRRLQAVLRNIQRLTSGEVTAWQASALCLAYDPHSGYMAPKDHTTHQVTTAAQLFGLGLALEMRDDYVTVTRVVPKGPAAQDGRIKVGDRILAVGQGDGGEMVDVIGVKLQEAVDLMRGPKGTAARLRVLHAGQFETTAITIQRDRVDLSNFGSYVFTKDALPAGRKSQVGYIYLPSFYVSGTDPQAADYHSTTRDVQRALEQFTAQGVDFVVLDLRHNNGGVLTESVRLPGLFVGPEGVVVQVKGHDGQVAPYMAEGVSVAWNGPLVVLTSRQSAGGAEIFAGAIQDYRRGLIVGDAKTIGMGTVATVIDMGQEAVGGDSPPKLGHLKVVTQKFYRPSGESTQLRGVVPDVVLPSPNDLLVLGEETYDYALAFDEIPAGRFRESSGSGLSDRTCELLAARSDARRAASAYFQQLAERASAKTPKRGWSVNLQQAAYFAERQAETREDSSTTIPGLEEVKRDGYLDEALSVALDYAGRAFYEQAEEAVRQKDYAGARRLYQRAVAADPNFTEAFYKHAWLLGTCPVAAQRDGKAAVESAQRACALDGEKNWQYVLTLAIAEAQAGDFDNARKHLKAALDNAPEEHRASYRHLEQRFQRRQAFPTR
jgi:carboxyl-terminal processing protease